MKLTHEDLITLGTMLGHTFLDDGLCKGFSGMLAQAMLAQDEQSFYERLSLIAQYKDNFNLLVGEIGYIKRKALNKDYIPSETEMQRLEILSFFDGMKLYLIPDKHTDVFNDTYVLQNNLRTIYSLTKPISQSEQNDISILLDKNYAGDEAGLIDYFDNLVLALSKSSSSLPIFLSSGMHSVLLSYNSKKKCWIYVDTNDFSQFHKNKTYYRELDTPTLVTSLFDSFFNEENRHTVFNTTIITNCPDNELQENLNKFDLSYPIKPEHTLMSNSNHSGLLYIACHNGHVDVVKELLKIEGIAVNQALTCGATPLYIACQNGRVGVVKELLKSVRIAVNQALTDGATPLYIACQNGHVGVVRELLKSERIAVNQAMTDGATPLCIVCQNGHMDVVKALLKSEGIAVNQEMSNGATPLYIACQNGHVDVVTALLKIEGIAVNQALIDGATPLAIACYNGHVDVVKELLKIEGIAVNLAKSNGAAPLAIACYNGHVGVVKELLKIEKIAVNQAMSNGVTPFAIACQKGHVDVVDVLIKHNKTLINKTVTYNIGIFIQAAKKLGRSKEMESLLKYKYGDHLPPVLKELTPLHLAAFFGQTPIFNKLLKAGAKLTDTQPGISVLEIAQAMNHEGILLLIEKINARRIRMDVTPKNRIGLFEANLNQSSGDSLKTRYEGNEMDIKLYRSIYCAIA